MWMARLSAFECGRRARRSNRTAAFAIFGLHVASVEMLCVGSGCAVTPDNTTGTTIQLDVVFDRTGFLVRDGAFTNMTVQPLFVGDSGDTNRAICAFVSINLNSLPADANVSRVVLNLDAVVLGGDALNPFADFGAMTVDHVNVVSGISASDYVGGTIQAAIGTIQPLPADGLLQDVAIDVTSQVNADRAAGRPISSFRFRFDAAPSADGQMDLVQILSSTENPDNRPSADATFTR